MLGSFVFNNMGTCLKEKKCPAVIQERGGPVVILARNLADTACPRAGPPCNKCTTSLLLWNKSSVLPDSPTYYSKSWIPVKFSNFQNLTQARWHLSLGRFSPVSVWPGLFAQREQELWDQRTWLCNSSGTLCLGILASEFITEPLCLELQDVERNGCLWGSSGNPPTGNQ